MTETIEPGRKIESLVEYRRSQLSDAFITDYDYIDKDTGCKMKEETIQTAGGATTTVERNQTHIYQCAPSLTSDIEILVLEAELVEEGKDLSNPHIPIDMDKLEEAKNRIEAKGLEPAWNQ